MFFPENIKWSLGKKSILATKDRLLEGRACLLKNR